MQEAIIDLRKAPHEKDLQYIWRIAEAKSAGLLDMSWPALSELFNKELRGEEPWWDESAYRKPYQSAKAYYEDVFSQMISGQYSNDIAQQKRELEKLKKQIQTEKLEYNKWLREEARDELIMEKIRDEIKNIRPLQMPESIIASRNPKSGILIFGDAHFGIEFKIPGLHGEIINSYSPEIFYERMNLLLQKTIEIIIRENFNEIYVFDMGDSIDGILRVKQLTKLKYGVVQSTVKYANYLCNWLNELSKHVKINFQMTHGNHSELRMLSQPKGTFTDDNMGEIVYEMINTRLSDNPNFITTRNETGLIFDNIQGFNLLGCHGEVKNLEKAIKDFSNIYKTEIDLLIGAHLHHSQSETVGIYRDVIRIPSIIGVDDFSMDLFKASNPGATFIVIEKNEGKTMEYNIKL